MKKEQLIAMVSGIIIGVSLAGPAAQAVETWFKAVPSTQSFYVDGHRVALEAYSINGYNYVKLRDIGREVGFNVSYDPMMNAAIVITGETYSDESQLGANAGTVVDYTSQVNPAVFTGELTREAYNGIRDSIVHKEEILAGTYEPIPIGDVPNHGPVVNVMSSIGKWPHYQWKRSESGSPICNVRYLESCKGAYDHVQPFIRSLEGLSGREKVKELVWYVADRMTYAVRYPFIDDVLTQDEEIPGCCMAYSYCFQFLCNVADIPCVLITSADHMWAEVYVDGQWWAVDPTGDDVEESLRSYIPVLHDPSEFCGANFTDLYPECIEFAKEILVPSTTKSKKAARALPELFF